MSLFSGLFAIIVDFFSSGDKAVLYYLALQGLFSIWVLRIYVAYVEVVIPRDRIMRRL